MIGFKFRFMIMRFIDCNTMADSLTITDETLHCDTDNARAHCHVCTITFVTTRVATSIRSIRNDTRGGQILPGLHEQ